MFRTDVWPQLLHCAPFGKDHRQKDHAKHDGGDEVASEYLDGRPSYLQIAEHRLIAVAADASHIPRYSTVGPVGTAAMRDPRLPERIVADLARWCTARGTSVSQLVGAVEWPR